MATPATTNDLAEQRDQVETFVTRQTAGMQAAIVNNTQRCEHVRQELERLHALLAQLATTTGQVDGRIAEDRRILGALQYQVDRADARSDEQSQQLHGQCQSGE